jgi:hypothetical protein
VTRGTVVTVLGFAGPDGSGKSSAVRAAADLATARGVPVHTVYLYGCVACRNLRVSRLLPPAMTSPGTIALESPQDPRRAEPSRWQRLHAAIDTAELAVRLTSARVRAGRTARRAGRGALVLTDRTPLDALSKHDPPRGSRVSHWLEALSGRYAVIALLDAGSDVLAARDGEHAGAGLERARDTYRRRAAELACVRTLSSHATPAEGLARDLLEQVLPPGGGGPQPFDAVGKPADDSSS